MFVYNNSLICSFEVNEFYPPTLRHNLLINRQTPGPVLIFDKNNYLLHYVAYTHIQKLRTRGNIIFWKQS